MLLEPRRGLQLGHERLDPPQTLTRDDVFYHLPTAERAVIATDEATKDTATLAEFADAGANPPPESAPSRSIGVPTLLVLGEHDALFCGPPDGPRCTEDTARAMEAPYYSPAARLEVRVIGGTGHALNQHVTAPLVFTRTLGWLQRRVPSRSGH